MTTIILSLPSQCYYRMLVNQKDIITSTLFQKILDVQQLHLTIQTLQHSMTTTTGEECVSTAGRGK